MIELYLIKAIRCIWTNGKLSQDPNNFRFHLIRMCKDKTCIEPKWQEGLIQDTHPFEITQVSVLVGAQIETAKARTEAARAPTEIAKAQVLTDTWLQEQDHIREYE